MSKILIAATIAVAAMMFGAMTPASADGALAVGTTSDVARDGIAFGTATDYDSSSEARDASMSECQGYQPAPKAAAQCLVIGTFKNQCFAISMDPKPGTPGAGWAIAPDKQTAEAMAMGNCMATAGPSRRSFCEIDESGCDGNAQ